MVYLEEKLFTSCDQKRNKYKKNPSQRVSRREINSVNSMRALHSGTRDLRNEITPKGGAKAAVAAPMSFATVTKAMSGSDDVWDGRFKALEKLVAGLLKIVDGHSPLPVHPPPAPRK